MPLPQTVLVGGGAALNDDDDAEEEEEWPPGGAPALPDGWALPPTPPPPPPPKLYTQAEVDARVNAALRNKDLELNDMKRAIIILAVGSLALLGGLMWRTGQLVDRCIGLAERANNQTEVVMQMLQQDEVMFAMCNETVAKLNETLHGWVEEAEFWKDGATFWRKDSNFWHAKLMSERKNMPVLVWLLWGVIDWLKGLFGVKWESGSGLGLGLRPTNNQPIRTSKVYLLFFFPH